MPLKDLKARREYQREWERKKYADAPRKRVLTPAQKARRREMERIGRANGTRSQKWDHSEAAKIHKRGYARKWRAKNPEKMQAQNKICYLRNLDRNADYYKRYARKYRAKDPQRARDSANRTYAMNRKAYCARAAAWRKRNPDKVLSFSQAARARKRNATTEDCSKRIAILKRERFCHWCCTAVTPKTVHIDHVVPLARDGKHCNDNLVASCRSCNISRKAKLISEWTWKEAA